jgi:hypothetical protein
MDKSCPKPYNFFTGKKLNLLGKKLIFGTGIKLTIIRLLCLLCGPALMGLFLSCGIEDYYYLSPVPVGNIRMNLNTRATILLPGVNDSYFTNYAIFYRIYISESNEPGEIQTSPASMSRVNSALYSDYAFFDNYTTSNTMVGASIGSLFRNRSFYPLDINSSLSLDTVLNNSASGRTITIDFQFAPPSITLSGGVTQTYQLYRSDNNGAFTPRPNRYFLNTLDLQSSAYANSTNNADVADLSNSTGAQRYTYAALYIVLVGIDLTTYSQIYSNPTFIGVMRLPD